MRVPENEFPSLAVAAGFIALVIGIIGGFQWKLILFGLGVMALGIILGVVKSNN